MVKNILVRVYMDTSQYNLVLETAQRRNIRAGTDSELIRKILFEYCEKIEALAFKLMKDQDSVKAAQEEITKSEAIIEQLRADLRNKATEIDIFKANLSRRKNVSKSREKKGN